MNETGESQAGSNGGLEFDEVVIDGHEYRVRLEIANEIIRLRQAGVEAILSKIKAVDPGENETIIITTPSSVSSEFVGQVGHLAKMNFPNNLIAVLPEGLDLHTQEGFLPLLEAANILAEKVPHFVEDEQVTKAAAVVRERMGYENDADIPSTAEEEPSGD